MRVIEQALEDSFFLWGLDDGLYLELVVEDEAIDVEDEGRVGEFVILL